MIHQDIQKKLIKYSIAMLILVAIIVVMDIFISAQVEAANKDMMGLNVKVAEARVNLANINNDQKKRVEANNFFLGYKDSPSARPENFTKDKAKELIAEMRQKFGLNRLELAPSGF